VRGLNELALFAGIGGGILAAKYGLGWRTRCAVEINPFCRSVLLARQRDGTLDPFPIWDDIRTFDGRPWAAAGAIDIVTGGFPCGDISVCGRGAGLEGKNSGLWAEMLRVITEVRPPYVFLENTPALLGRGLPEICGALSCLGYSHTYGIVSAASAGAPHLRKRLWLVAYSDSRRHRAPEKEIPAGGLSPFSGGRWPPEPNLARLDDGVPDRIQRIEALGRSQVPAVAALAFSLLHKRLEDEG